MEPSQRIPFSKLQIIVDDILAGIKLPTKKVKRIYIYGKNEFLNNYIGERIARILDVDVLYKPFVRKAYYLNADYFASKYIDESKQPFVDSYQEPKRHLINNFLEGFRLFA